jgi:hypothetical protein
MEITYDPAPDRVIPDNNGSLDEVEKAEKIEAVSSDFPGILVYG